MVSRWFVAFIEVLILLTCAMPISAEIRTVSRAITAWTLMLFKHPKSAIAAIWVGFWNSWLAVLTTFGFMYPFAMVPTFTGFGLSRAIFILANTMLFAKLCIAEELHGKKEERRAFGHRASVIVLMLFILGLISFLENGMVTNSDRGNKPTLADIWKASFFWKPQTLQTSVAPQDTRPATPPYPVLPKEIPKAESPVHGSLPKRITPKLTGEDIAKGAEPEGAPYGEGYNPSLKEEERLNRMSLTQIRAFIAERVEKLKAFESKWNYPAPQEIDAPALNSNGGEGPSKEAMQDYWKRLAAKKKVEYEVRPTKRFNDFQKQFPNISTLVLYLHARSQDIPMPNACFPNSKMYEGDAKLCAEYLEQILDKYPRPQ